MTVAADPDPYFALPSLRGAPAYSRARKAVPDSVRPLDPDDLPIDAEQSDVERALLQALQASGSYRLSTGLGPTGTPYEGLGSPASPHGTSPGANGSNGSNGSNGDGVGGRRFSLRALTDRLGPGPK